MAWGVKLNRDHVRLWQRLAMLWGGFVLFGLVAGMHLNPRLDEITFIALLPLAVLVPYALICAALALIRLLWVPQFLQAFQFRRLTRNLCLRQDPRPQTYRRLAD